MSYAYSRARAPHAVHPSIYENGEYLRKNPNWHTHESPWKADQLLLFLRRNNLAPRTICEVGCGAGEVLRQLQARLPSHCEFTGYEISPQAFQMCREKANARLAFKLMDIQDDEVYFDLALVLDVVEHLEDYFTFLRGIRSKARYTIFHLPLDLSVQTVLRPNGLLKRRNLHDHLHYFSKEIALRTLQDVEYEVLDYIYTPRSNQLGTELVQKVLSIPRKILFRVNQNFAVRLLGGYSLLVLTRPPREVLCGLGDPIRGLIGDCAR